MARPLRIEFPGGLYHVTARGNGRLAIFADDTDRERFLLVLTSVVSRYHVLCHAYCLMDNHYHMLLETPEANLSRAMRQLNGVYSQAFNRRHQRPGHVLEGRFHARVVDQLPSDRRRGAGAGFSDGGLGAVAWRYVRAGGG